MKHLLPKQISSFKIDLRIKLLKRLVLSVALIVVLPGVMLAQDSSIAVTGIVKDNAGEPLVGVSVSVDGTTTGTITGVDGVYRLNVPGRNAKLNISYIGYITQGILVGGRNQIDVTMIEDTRQLDEVIVVGYGTQKKVNLTGSISSINSETLKNRPTSSLASALQGSMPGVTVTQNSGQPGAGRGAGTIRVRGVGTLNNSNPMVVIDGIVSSMDDINPDDIENLTVLKDAASSAIYGSRAANGVILITTKKGKNNSLQLNLNINVGVQSPTRLPEYLGSATHATLYNEALVNEGKPKAVSDADIQKYANGSDPYGHPDTDWLDLLYQGSGLQQNYYMDLTGGGENTRYAFSIGYFDQDGIIKETDYKRYTGRMNLNSDIKKWLTLNAGLSYSLGKTMEPTSSMPNVPDFSQLIRQANRISPMIPYKYKNGYYGYINDGSPMAWLEQGGSNNWSRGQVLGNIGLEIELLPGLKLKPTFGYGNVSNNQHRFIKDIQYYNSSGAKTLYQGPNNLYEKRISYTDLTYQALLTYDRSFMKHNISALAGWSRESEDYNFVSGYRKNFLNNELEQLNSAPSDGQEAKGSAYQWALESYFGRLNYNYDNKYYLEANVRRDGSSKFASGSQWGTFPSFSAGWRISEEAFFKNNVQLINDLKIRGSWGKLGNQFLPTDKDNADNFLLPYYPTYPIYSSGQDYNFGGSIASGLAQTKGANPYLKWEATESYGAGLDIVLLKQALVINVDYYNRLTTNILQVPPVSGAYGLDAPAQNIGSVRNEGWDFVVSYNNSAGKFHYNVSANFAYVDNKVEKLVNNKPIIDGATVLMEGYSINSYYGYECEGIFQDNTEIQNHASQALGGTTKPGDLKYKNQNGDKVINGDDRVVLAKTFAPYTFGFNISLSYSDFDLGIFCQGAAGHYGPVFQQSEFGTAVGKSTPDMLDRWQQPGDTKYPRLLASQKQNLFASNPSDFWLKKRDYLRLKNLQLGYNIPGMVLSKLGLQKARIYYSAQNILTLTKFSQGIDPEMNGSLYDHPQVFVNSFGLNVTF